MALVAYENSDSDEFEDDDHGETGICILNPVPESSKTVIQNDNKDGGSLFNLLPQPSSKKPAVIEEDDEFLKKKEVNVNLPKPKAKITVPSLSDFKDVEGSIPNKPKTPSLKKSGLLSMLPQPKNSVTSTTTSKSLIPHVLTKKPPTTTVKKKSPIPTPKLLNIDAKSSLGIVYSDDSDNEDVQNDFFSMNKPLELPKDDLPLNIDTNSSIPTQNNEPRSIESYFKKDVVDVDEMEINETTYHDGESNQYTVNGESGNGYASSSNEVGLDEEAIRKLCGTRGKRKREEIQIVDVNQQEVLADAREWLMKGLMDDTTKRVSSSKKKGNEPTNQQKRKHQITYLAHQAKANEAELQNQWANNRMTKRQTQSKYGF